MRASRQPDRRHRETAPQAAGEIHRSAATFSVSVFPALLKPVPYASSHKRQNAQHREQSAKSTRPESLPKESIITAAAVTETASVEELDGDIATENVVHQIDEYI